MPWFAVMLGLLSALIWGMHSSVSILAIREGWTSIDLTAARIGGSLLIAIIWLLARKWQQRRQAVVGELEQQPIPVEWRKMLALTCFVGLPYSLINIAGLQFAPITHSAAISLGLSPVLAAFLSKLILGQSISTDHWSALLLITVGIGSIWMGTSISWQYLIGDLCFLIGATLWALYAIYLRHWQIKPEQAAIYIALCSSPYLLWYLLTRALPTTDMTMLLLQLAYQGAVVGMLAILFYGKTVTILGSQLGTLFSALPPVVVPIVADLILGYQSDFYEYLGIVMVFTGMILAFAKPIQRLGRLSESN